MPVIYRPVMVNRRRRLTLRLNKKPIVSNKTEMAQGLRLSMRAAAVTTGKVRFMGFFTDGRQYEFGDKRGRRLPLPQLKTFGNPDKFFAGLSGRRSFDHLLNVCLFG